MSELAGKLLVAHPSLRDPNFIRSVIFLPIHDEKEGAFGLVLNRPLGQKLSQLLPDQDLGPLENFPVYIGGPVATNQLSFIEMGWDPASGEVRFNGNLSLEDAREMAMLEGDVVRPYVGYSGWSGGQLENELESQAWLVRQPQAEIFEAEGGVEVWRSIMKACGPWFRLVADEPDDPSLN